MTKNAKQIWKMGHPILNPSEKTRRGDTNDFTNISVKPRNS